MPIVLVYARASGDQKGLGTSVAGQLGDCKRYAATHWPGLTVHTFSDNAKSGANPDTVRAGFDDLVAFIRQADPGEIVAMVTNEQSRLTRQGFVHWDQLAVTLNRAGVAEVHTLDKGTVSVQPGSRLLGDITALIDAEEAARAKERSRKGKERMLAEGRPGSKSGGYGYRPTIGPDGRKALEIIPEQADGIRMIIHLICEGHSLNSICKRLNAGELYLPGREKTWWSTQTLRKMVDRPAIAGMRSRTVYLTPNSKTPSQQIVGKATWEPIISLERREQLLAAMNRKEVIARDGTVQTVRRSEGKPMPRRWLLTGGIGRCGKCGANLKCGGWHDRTRYICLSTSKGCNGISIIRPEAVERYVYRQLCAHLSRNPKIPAELAAEPNPEVDRLLAEKFAAQADYEDAFLLRKRHVISTVEFEDMRADARERLDRTVAALEAIPDDDREVPDVDTILEHWGELTLVRKRRALAHYVDQVVLGPGKMWYPNDLARFEHRIKILWRQPAPVAETVEIDHVSFAEQPKAQPRKRPAHRKAG